jgi:hypothetical protein
MRKLQMLALLILLGATVLAPAKQLGWKQFFDGKTLSGWQHVGPGSFVVWGFFIRPSGPCPIARSESCTRWSTKTITPVYSSVYPQSPQNHGCR